MTRTNTDPLLADAVAWRQLSGLSGAQVWLMTRDHRHWFVRKAACKPEGNERLRRQSLKQHAWIRDAQDVFRTPQILDEGESEGRYYFDMEAVRGMDGVGYLRSADYEAVGRFCDRLCRYVRFAAAAQPLSIKAAGQCLFDALYARVCEVHRRTSLPAADELSSVLLSLERIRALDNPPPTWCHGDLTLENLVIDEQGAVWVVDMLDAPYEHYWLDVAKLHQDVDGGWYLRHQAPIARCVTEYVGRRLFETAVELDPSYAGIHYVLLAVTFLRILPYVQDSKISAFVQERVRRYAQRLRS